VGSLTIGFTGLMEDLLYTFDDIFTIDGIYDTFTIDDIYDTCRETYYYILYYYSPEEVQI